MDALSRSALDFFNTAEKAPNLGALIEAFAPVAKAAACTSLACHHIARSGGAITPRLLFAWRMEQPVMLRLHDRLSRGDGAMNAVFLSSSPARWRDLADGDDAADDFDGLITPIHGPLGDILCVVLLGKAPTLLDRQTRMTLQVVAAQLAHRGSSLVEIEADPARSRPSLRDTQCAVWAGRGKTDWEIGRILELHEDTVAFHLDRLKARMGVSERAQLRGVSWLAMEPQDD